MSIDFEDFKKRRVEGAIVAFVRGTKNMNWVMGVIKGKWGVQGNGLERIFDKIPTLYINYNKNLLKQLKQRCLNERLVSKL